MLSPILFHFLRPPLASFEQEKELEEAAEEAKEEAAAKVEVVKKPVAAKKAKPCCEQKEEGAAFLELNAQLEAAGVCTQCK